MPVRDCNPAQLKAAYDHLARETERLAAGPIPPTTIAVAAANVAMRALSDTLGPDAAAFYLREMADEIAGPMRADVANPDGRILPTEAR